MRARRPLLHASHRLRHFRVRRGRGRAARRAGGGGLDSGRPWPAAARPRRPVGAPGRGRDSGAHVLRWPRRTLPRAAPAGGRMMGRVTAIAFDRVVKNFRHFASPLQRLKEALHPLGKVYHTPLPVLRDVTFDIPRGQTAAVLGPNGVGKSTLLHLAAGVLEPSSGVVTVGGSVFALLDLAGGFATALTGRENLRFFHDVIARGGGDRAEMEREVQAFAEVGEYFDRPLRTYSSGMLLRLAFAAAVAAEPGILLFGYAPRTVFPPLRPRRARHPPHRRGDPRRRRSLSAEVLQADPRATRQG